MKLHKNKEDFSSAIQATAKTQREIVKKFLKNKMNSQI